MLQAILKSKLGPVLSEDAWALEDMLTGIALGACEYVPPHAALVPFLETARTRQGAALRLGGAVVRRAKFVFWDWRSAVVRPSDGVIIADGGEPELIIELQTDLGSKWLLIEAKLRSGKSSDAHEKPGIVTDQLAKYWLHLLEIAGEDAVGVVYVTSHMACPIAEIDASERELAAYGHRRPELYWTHWRAFTKIAEAGADAYPLLRDVAAVLTAKFELVAIVESWEWPVRVEPPRWWVSFGWSWPACPEVPGGSRFGWTWPEAVGATDASSWEWTT